MQIGAAACVDDSICLSGGFLLIHLRDASLCLSMLLYASRCSRVYVPFRLHHKIAAALSTLQTHTCGSIRHHVSSKCQVDTGSSLSLSSRSLWPRGGIPCANKKFLSDLRFRRETLQSRRKSRTHHPRRLQVSTLGRAFSPTRPESHSSYLSPVSFLEFFLPSLYCILGVVNTLSTGAAVRLRTS
jgi:hypothetical protein